MYIADLDAIRRAQPSWTYASIRAGAALLVDAGVREAAQAQRLADAGIDRIIVGLETLAGPAELRRIVQHLGSTRIVFSLDLRDGRPLGDVAAWAKPDPEAIARQAIDAGVAAMIVLDLARVGVGEGMGTEDLCRRLHAKFSGLELMAGGGVRGVADLHRLRECGVHVALVASSAAREGESHGKISPKVNSGGVPYASPDPVAVSSFRFRFSTVHTSWNCCWMSAAARRRSVVLSRPSFPC